MDQTKAKEIFFHCTHVNASPEDPGKYKHLEDKEWISKALPERRGPLYTSALKPSRT